MINPYYPPNQEDIDDIIEETEEPDEDELSRQDDIQENTDTLEEKLEELI